MATKIQNFILAQSTGCCKVWLKLTAVRYEDVENYCLKVEGLPGFPQSITTPGFITFILGKMKMTLQEINLNGTVKINMHITDY